MSKFYSKTTGGFYDSNVNATMPPDAIAVTDELYAALFAAQASGQIIQADANGNPKAVNLPPPSPEQLRAALAVSAKNALDKSDTTIIRCYSAGIAVPNEWQTYRNALRAIVNGADTTSTILPTIPTYPEGS